MGKIIGEMKKKKQFRYTRRIIVDSKDHNIIDNKDEKNPIKTGIIGRPYNKQGKWGIKYIYEDKEYFGIIEVLKEYESKHA